jgi:hypothetical protein
MPKKLFRPVGLPELSLLWDSGMRRFPHRLAHQPIFYPVVNVEYARQIARDWNTPDANSGFAGYVTEFGVSATYLTKYELRTAGSAAHQEYWIPANELNSFNKAIQGLISVEEAYFGPQFVGYVPGEHRLKGQNAAEQFTTLSGIVDFGEFASEISVNRKAVFLNCLYWLKADASGPGDDKAKHLLFTRLIKAWKANEIGVPLPVRLKKEQME